MKASSATETQVLPYQLDLNTHEEVRNLDDFINWYSRHEEQVHQLMNLHGGVLLRDTMIRTDEDFARFSELVSKGEKLNYAAGNSPRTNVKGGVYTSTEFSADRNIAIHNEMSYASAWPSKIFFCSIIPAETGGETPLANSREIYEQLPAHIIEDFENRGVAYLRNLHGGDGIGISWMDTFETQDPAVAEKIMDEAGMEYQWSNGHEQLWLRQVRDAVLTHPVHGYKVWFNQADEFHPSSNGEETYEAMMALYDGDINQFPLYAQFGDGTEIPLDYLRTIRETIENCIVTFPWQQGDVLALDNLLIGHGRRPFTGKRRTLVAMSN